MPLVFFSFPDDARWNPETEAVEFSVAVGDYEGTVRVRIIIFPLKNLAIGLHSDIGGWRHTAV